MTSVIAIDASTEELLFSCAFLYNLPPTTVFVFYRHSTARMKSLLVHCSPLHRSHWSGFAFTDCTCSTATMLALWAVG